MDHRDLAPTSSHLWQFYARLSGLNTTRIAAVPQMSVTDPVALGPRMVRHPHLLRPQYCRTRHHCTRGTSQPGNVTTRSGFRPPKAQGRADEPPAGPAPPSNPMPAMAGCPANASWPALGPDGLVIRGGPWARRGPYSSIRPPASSVGCRRPVFGLRRASLRRSAAGPRSARRPPPGPRRAATCPRNKPLVRSPRRRERCRPRRGWRPAV